MKKVEDIYGYADISGLIPGVRGQRAFPTAEFRNSDPFVMLDHIGPEVVGTNFFLDGKDHDHPHRGFETITFMFEGRMDHRDSLDNHAKLLSGSVQRMNAGSGIVHGGDMYSDNQTGRFHEMQLWVNNPAEEKMSTPGITNLLDTEIPVAETENIKLRVISGELNGVKGKLKTKATTQIAHLVASGSGEIEIGNFLPHSTTMVYVLEGSTKLGETLLNKFQLAKLEDDGDKILLKVKGPAQLMVLSGIPLNEPIAFGGPFVMNTQEEINQANLDFQNGAFGSIK